MSIDDAVVSPDTEQYKTRRVTLVVLEAEYNTLCRMSTQDGGLHPTDYGSRLLSERILSRALELEANGADIPHLHIFIRDHEGREREQVIGALKRIASRHVRDATEKSLEELKALCDEEGVSVEEIMDDLAESPAVPVVSNAGDTLARAMNWVIEFMRGKERIASVAAFEAAKLDGFTQRTIELAKNRLGIPSRKMAKGIWYWVNEKPMQSDIDALLGKTAKKRSSAE